MKKSLHVFFFCVLLQGINSYALIARNNQFRARITVPHAQSPFNSIQLNVSRAMTTPKILMQQSKLYVENHSKWLKTRLSEAVINMKVAPWQYISIPIMAAVVGYVTNWVGVQMLFYPIDWVGVPIVKWAEQPFGILGWQGSQFLRLLFAS